MLEKRISKLLTDAIIKYLDSDKTGKETCINLFNSGIVINLTSMKKIVSEKGREKIEKALYYFLKSR